MLRLVGTLHLHTDIVGLRLCKCGEVYTDAFQMQASYLLVEMLGQAVHVNGVLLAEELNLGQGLVGKRVTHHE